ncbi:hypothetical protein HKX42_06390 [Salinisphaera sp. USBA-960]|nr:hypothetical protein [Salifodinibacter halophilus]NNC26502.1 hypothetical protein [Salifodinibacter halophilus]
MTAYPIKRGIEIEDRRAAPRDQRYRGHHVGTAEPASRDNSCTAGSHGGELLVLTDRKQTSVIEVDYREILDTTLKYYCIQFLSGFTLSQQH